MHNDLWLEDVFGDKALNWVHTQNQLTAERLTAYDSFTPMQNAARELLDDNARIPHARLHGEFAYNLWTCSQNQRGLWRRMPLKEYQNGGKEWQLLLDIDELAQMEGKSWVFHGYNFCNETSSKVLLKLSPGGTDANVVREFDLDTCQFVEDGFYIEESKTQVCWGDENTLYVGTSLDAEGITESGYTRRIRRWSRGTAIETATPVKEIPKTDMVLCVGVLDNGSEKKNLLTHCIDFYHYEYWLIEGTKTAQLNLPQKSGICGYIGNQIIFQNKESLDIGGKTVGSGSLLRVSIAEAMKEKPGFTILLESTRELIVSSVSTTAEKIVVVAMKDVKSKLLEFKLDNGEFSYNEVGFGNGGSINITATHLQKNLIHFLYDDFLTPSGQYQLGEDGTPRLLNQLAAKFDSSVYQVEQCFTESDDGTLIPYFIVATKGYKKNSNNPTLLYGYGGFEISLQPHYSSTLEKLWLRQGGIYVLANIRGGGEYGPDWHQAALTHQRLRAYEDFSSVAKDLCKRKITSPQKLGAQGGSNGGLLMGVMLTRYPELFNAIVCQVPLLDMMRYHHLLAGASWMAEYGDPDKTEDRDYILNYSPYQNAAADKEYPPVIFMTSTRDDRVHPGHARRMAKLLLDQGHDVDYYENTEGGHGGAADSSQRAYWLAIQFQYLKEKLMD